MKNKNKMKEIKKLKLSIGDPITLIYRDDGGNIRTAERSFESIEKLEDDPDGCLLRVKTKSKPPWDMNELSIGALQELLIFKGWKTIDLDPFIYNTEVKNGQNRRSLKYANYQSEPFKIMSKELAPDLSIIP